MDRKSALLYAKTNGYKRLKEKTMQLIEATLEKGSNPYVACSFGKDSSVLLHLLRSIRPDIPAIFVCYPETPLLDNYEDVITRWGVGLKLIRCEVTANIEAEVNERDILPHFAKQLGLEKAYIGLRKEESVGRRIYLSGYDPFTGLNVCPLANWKLADVTACIFENDIPMLRTYELGGLSERTTTGLAGEAWNFRSAQIRRMRSTDLLAFNTLIKQYPHLAKYA